METRSSRGRGWAVIFVVLAALVVGGLFRSRLLRLPGSKVIGSEKIALKIAKDDGPVNLGQFQNGFASVIDPVLPAVVNISSTKVVKVQNKFPGFFNDPFFRQFFGNQAPPASPQTEREYSLGSGVVINPDGYILTNNHVISGASDVEVLTQNKKKYKAKVIGTDPRTDIAVLKIDASGLTTFTLGDSSKLRVGDLVFAIGDPFGVGETATMGVVSAKGRGFNGAIERYENFIQTDAAINPGNSGGALIDARGNLIGINTAIISGAGGNEGIGFAIPINMARNIMEQILAHGKVVRGFLGVHIQEVTPDMAKAFGLEHGGGALVAGVNPGSPAAKAGIERGDIILEVDGQAINGPDDLSVRTSEMSPGTIVHLKVFRNGKTRDVEVTLGIFPENAESGATGGSQGTALQGLKVRNMTPDLAQHMGLPSSTTGVVVTDVDPSSPAAEADIQQGDVIQEVNHKPVKNIEDFQKAASTADNQPVLLLINRGGSTLYTVVEPQ